MRTNRVIPISVAAFFLYACGDKPEPAADEGWPEWAVHVGPEEKRHAIWDEFTAADDRALKEAEAAFPTEGLLGPAADEQFQKQMLLLGELQAKYEKDVMDKYDLSEEDHKTIGLEAYKKKWPPADWKGQ